MLLRKSRSMKTSAMFNKTYLAFVGTEGPFRKIWLRDSGIGSAAAKFYLQKEESLHDAVERLR